jgi:DnaJ-class molecular chaperone
MTDKPDRNYYQFLGLSSRATVPEIKLAIRRKIKDNHPDLFPNEPAKLKITQLCNEATRWLTTDLRATHDRIFGDQSSSGTSEKGEKRGQSSRDSKWNGPNPGRADGERKKYRTQGENIQGRISITFFEAFLGCIGECKGARFRVPAGISSGKTIRVPGKGDKSPDGGARGDLFVTVHVESNPVFSYHLSSKELCITVPLTELEALIGIELSANYFDGSTFSVLVPPGSHKRDTWKVQNKNRGKSDRLPDSYWIKLNISKSRSLLHLSAEDRVRFEQLNASLFPSFHREFFQ